MFMLGRHRSTILVFVVAAIVLAACAQLKQCAYEGVNRDDWQQPQRVIAALNVRPGDQVADLGAGSGYFTFRLAKAVAPTGKVYAVDTDQDMVALVAERAKKEAPSLIEPILAKPDRLRLILFSSSTTCAPTYAASS